MHPYSVLVPRDDDSAAALTELLGKPLARGAAIVASGRGRETIEVLILASRSPAQERFADLVRRTGREGRRVLVPRESLVAVGIFDDYSGEIRLQHSHAHLLSAYLGRSVGRGDLEASDSREAQRQQARLEARRAQIGGNIIKAMEIRAKHNIWYW